MITTNRQLANVKKKWQLVRDCITDSVKDKAVTGANYNGQDGYILGDGATPRTDDGFICYALRPSFDNYVINTLDVLMGAAFFKGFEFTGVESGELPDSLEYIKENSDGSGLTLQDHLFETMRETASIGRVGMWVVVDGDNSERAQSERIDATARIFKAEQIEDWSEAVIGGRKQLNYVKLREEYDRIRRRGTEFSREQYCVIYELFLDDDGLYSIAIDDQSTQGGKEIVEPRLGNGQRLDFIPFQFIGSINNTPSIDTVPLYKISDINISLYNIDAANAQLIQLYSSPLMSFDLGDGISPEEFMLANNIGDGESLRVSNAAYVGCSVNMAQVSSSTVGIEYSDKKINRMAQLGAQIITVGQNETAEAARIRKSSGLANLTQIIDNVEQAYRNVIKWLSMMNNQSGMGDEFELVLNRKLFDDRITPQMMQQLITMNIQGKYSDDDLYKVLKDNDLTQAEDALEYQESLGSAINQQTINPDE